VINSIGVTDLNFQLITPIEFPIVIPPDVLKTYNVGFSPIMKGDILGELHIESNDPSHQLLIIVLSGEGVGTAENDPRVRVTTDKQEYKTGDQYDISVELRNPGETRDVDLYIFCRIPDGTVFFLTGNGFFFEPEAINFIFPGNSFYPVTIFNSEVVDYTPRGEYLWGAGLFEPGTLIPIGDVDTVYYTVLN
jgi:hypothetical protein